MARTAKLKVFRTPIGFHDAYVAAPSQKAALEAWGADSNLFASGSAERVDDPKLMAEPLATPGQVIRRPRGSLAEHMAALPRKNAGKPRSANSARPDPAADDAAPRKPSRKPRPQPSRAALDRAEGAQAALEKRQAGPRAELARRQAELDRERRLLEERQDRERAEVAARVEAARDKYDTAMRAWRAD